MDSEAVRDKSLKLTWYEIALAFLGGMAGGMLLCAVYVKYEYNLPDGPTPMKDFLEHYGLNLLGDTIAGLFGAATLIVVLFTFFSQRSMARQTIVQMEQQNLLSGQIANANYQLSLFDKRVKTYNHFNDAKSKFMTDDSRTPEIIQAFGNAVREAEFVYDEDMNKRLRELADDAATLHLIATRLERLQIQKGDGEWPNQQKEEEYYESILDYSDLSEKVFSVLGSKEIREGFNKHLKLPDTIVADIQGTATKQ